MAADEITAWDLNELIHEHHNGISRESEANLMAESKTTPTSVNPFAFLKTVENEQRQRDGKELLDLMKEVTGESPRMWGPSITALGNIGTNTIAGEKVRA